MRSIMILLVGIGAVTPVAAQSIDSTAAKMSRRAIFDLTSSMALQTKIDRFAGVTTVTAGKGLGQLEVAPPFTMIFFTPGYFIKDGSAHYAITVAVGVREWAFLGGSIEFLIDGQPARLDSPTMPQRDVRDGYVSEVFSATIPIALFARLAKAYDVEIRLTGQRHTYEGRLPLEVIARFWKLSEAPKPP